ncbi:polycomb group RING finger protein 1-like [Xenia sp. Carnegie-2017]|uniref:polycomb group RING finger protein 1-like n=1 Tax=Xenia sp. Carnegie-2017 TaxID=2897299 RepID=UPI001F04084A|nr:polycomb group RING finger protein 1-like [Xenia sp. Carnegie-2017]
MLFKSVKITSNVGQPRSYKLDPSMAHMQNVNDNHRVLMSTKQFRRKRSRKVIPTVPEKWKEEFDKLALKPRSIQIKLLNPHITCPVCQGYLVDAITITECLHSFCRGCIVKHFERVRCNYKCPLCHELVHKTNPWYNLKTDCVLQDIVNKLVPDFAEAEERQRRVFYKSRGLAIPDKVIKPDIQRPQINHTTVTRAESNYSQSHSQQVQEAPSEPIENTPEYYIEDENDEITMQLEMKRLVINTKFPAAEKFIH